MGECCNVLLLLLLLEVFLDDMVREGSLPWRDTGSGVVRCF